MSDHYTYFTIRPVFISGRDLVAPAGYVSDAQRALIMTAQRTSGTAPDACEAPDGETSLRGTQIDPWGDLR